MLIWLFYLITFSVIYLVYSMAISGSWLLGFLQEFQADLEYGPIFGALYNSLRTATCLALNGFVIHAIHKRKNRARELTDSAQNVNFLTPNVALIFWLIYYLTFYAMLESLIAFTPYEWKIWLVSSSTGEHIAELGCEYDAVFELIFVALTFNCAFIYITSIMWNEWKRRPEVPTGDE